MYLPPGYDDEPGGGIPRSISSKGLRASWDVAQPTTVEEELSRAGGRALRQGRSTPLYPRVGGLLDFPRRKPVPRLTGDIRYHTYLCEEIVLWRHSHHRTLPTRDHRAIAGKSSGGYGAMVTPMLRPDSWEVLPPTLAMPSLRHAISPTSGHRFGRFEIITQVPSRIFGGLPTRSAFSRRVLLTSSESLGDGRHSADEEA